MKKIYYLQTCDKCRKILKKIDTSDCLLQEIKTEPITVKQLEELYSVTKSYKALFSKRAKKYKEMGLKNQNLNENDFRQLILDDYTFLKRPIIIFENDVFIEKLNK